MSNNPYFDGLLEADEKAEPVSAAEYKKRTREVICFKLPQSRMIASVRALMPDVADRLSLEMASYEGMKGKKDKKDADLSIVLNVLNELAETYLPMITVEPVIESSDSSNPDALKVSDIMNKDKYALLVWGATGDLPEQKEVAFEEKFRGDKPGKTNRKHG